MQWVLKIVNTMSLLIHVRKHTSVGKVAKDGRRDGSHWWSYDFALVEDLLPLFGEQRSGCIEKSRHTLPAYASDGAWVISD